MKRKILVVAGAALLAPAGLPAAEPVAKPEAFEALLRCRSIAESEARLACFDGAAASLQAAAESREVVVVDRQQIRDSKRTLFGLSIPRLSLFDDDKDEEEEIKSIEGVVQSAHRDEDGRWVVRLQEGGVWRQIDSNTLGRRPRSGMKVEINRAAVGSFKMRVAGQPGIRVRRES